MPNPNQYGGIIWTNHALERLQQRKLPRSIAILAFQQPDEQVAGKRPGMIELRKRYKNSLITLIMNKNERNEWVVVSAWIDPPLPGTLDHKKHEHWKKFKKAGFWGKLWLSLRKQVGWY